MSALDEFKKYSGVIIDAYLVVDREQQIIDFNPLFYQMLPKALARGLKRKTFGEVVTLELEHGVDLVGQALSSARTLRFDEVRCVIGERELVVIVSAVPFYLSGGDQPDSALILIRDVTDEATVQVKYKQMLEIEENEKAKLQYKITEKSTELLSANEKLNELQLELMEYRKGLRLL